MPEHRWRVNQPKMEERDGGNYNRTPSLPDNQPIYQSFTPGQPQPFYNQPIYPQNDNMANYMRGGLPPPATVQNNPQVPQGIQSGMGQMPGNFMQINDNGKIIPGFQMVPSQSMTGNQNQPGPQFGQPIALKLPQQVPGPPNYPNQGLETNISSDMSPQFKKKVTKNKTPVPRRRALTACNTCRTKKVKCDNLRPRCGACVKNGIETCEYVNEDQIKEITSYDSMSNTILQRLDIIMDDLKVIKEKNEGGSTKKVPQNVSNGSPLWDMSLTTILQWDYFSEKIPGILDDYKDIDQKLLKAYDVRPPKELSLVLTMEQKFNSLRLIESVFFNSLNQCINSFFINCHTKVPVLDVLEFIESIELYKIFHKYIGNFSLLRLSEDFELIKIQSKEIGDLYLELVTKHPVEDSPFRRKAYFNLCKSIPLIPVVCALGILSSPVQLNNFGSYQTSLEERRDLSTSCLTKESIKLIPEGIPKERLAISSWLITFSQTILIFCPGIYKKFSLNSIFYHLFLSQFHLYILKPTIAFEEINISCQHMMHYLNKKRDSSNQVVYENENKRRVVERLFWSCLKLECELKTELSPKISTSGITNIEPPCQFPTIPESILEDENVINSKHSKECLQFASKFDDQYTWYYFLTEIAIRKAENETFNELYSIDASKARLWDQPKFYEETFWTSFIKGINQYNGIINSLSPRIRSFVLEEVDTENILKSITKAYERRRSKQLGDDEIAADLDEFLIDNNLLIQSQSESIMYIKTRILTSKLILFRPMIYLILNNKIPMQDLIEGALAVFNDSQVTKEPESISSISDLSSHLDNERAMDYDKILEAPLYYQRSNVDEDFSTYFVNNDMKPSNGSFFRMDLLPNAKKQIIKLFFIHLKTVPKLNIPKLGAHRHPGQWYYLRNLLIGNFYMFLLFKKLQDFLDNLRTNASAQKLFFGNPLFEAAGDISGIIENLLPRQTIIYTLQHSLLVYDYWKDEAEDCKIYASLVRRCLEALEETPA